MNQPHNAPEVGHSVRVAEEDDRHWHNDEAVVACHDVQHQLVDTDDGHVRGHTDADDAPHHCVVTCDGHDKPPLLLPRPQHKKEAEGHDVPWVLVRCGCPNRPDCKDRRQHLAYRTRKTRMLPEMSQWLVEAKLLEYL